MRETGQMLPLRRLLKQSCRAALVGLLVSTFAPAVRADDNPWPTLKQATFGGRDIKSEDGTVVLDAPQTAEDAGIVPITVRIPPSVTQPLKSMTLIIDKNPNPVVATLRFGPAAGSGGERSLSTRVRVDTFSHVRAIVETEDGTLHMATKFVQAAGGCAAMEAKDPDTDRKGLGKMIVKVFPPALSTTPLFQGQVMLKHPNENGMQLDINTGKFIPARYVKQLTVRRGGELVFALDSSFSISTNPNFRFSFARGSDNDLDVTVIDTDGTVFAARSEPSGS